MEEEEVVVTLVVTSDCTAEAVGSVEVSWAGESIEVPVTKVYPPARLGQTKMKPIVGWWSILRPLVYVGLGLKK